MNDAISSVSWNLRETNNFVNPPFVYKANNVNNDPTVYYDNSHTTNIIQRSPLRIYIWRAGRLISNQTY